MFRKKLTLFWLGFIWFFITFTSCLSLCISCSVIRFPTGATPFIPPSWYKDLFQHDLECSGLSYTNYDSIVWYWVPGASFPSTINKKELLAGEEIGTNIIISESYLAHPMIIRHELMHLLLLSTPDTTKHPNRYFNDLCFLTWDNYNSPENISMHDKDSVVLSEYKLKHGKLDLPNGQ